MITVVSQSTSERVDEIKALFESIKPLLDKGYSYTNALISVGRIPQGSHIFPTRGWGKSLIDYGTACGYPYNVYKRGGRRK